MLCKEQRGVRPTWGSRAGERERERRTAPDVAGHEGASHGGGVADLGAADPLHLLRESREPGRFLLLPPPPQCARARGVDRMRCRYEGRGWPGNGKGSTEIAMKAAWARTSCAATAWSRLSLRVVKVTAAPTSNPESVNESPFSSGICCI